MRYRIAHTTTYEYSEPVTLSYNEARLLPRPCPNQHCLAAHLEISPAPVDYREREDFFGNRVAYFSIREPHSLFSVTAHSEIALEQSGAPWASQEMGWETVRDTLWHLRDPRALDARQFALPSHFVPADGALGDYGAASFLPGRSLLHAVHDLMQRIHAEFLFDPDFTEIATPLATVLAHRRGVCQDFAHLAIGCLRAQGLAARYVSGYIENLPPPGEIKMVGADVSHAWFSVFVPDFGWMDFDPTNNQVPQDRHITVAWGRDYADVTPLKGVIFGGRHHALQVVVEVERLD